jgi:phospholipid transport system substrate-binding protein
MPRLLLIPIIAAAILVVAARPAAAGPVTDAVRDASTTMKSLLRTKASDSAAEKKLAAQVTRRLRGFLDIDELGKLALTDHWDKLDKAKRAEYLTLLRTLIEANYIRGLRANLDYKVSYGAETRRGGDVIVATKIHTERKGRTAIIEVEYLLRRDGERWRAVDVITDGVGLVENYRAQFNRIIAKEGFDGLLERMRKKAKKAA